MAGKLVTKLSKRQSFTLNEKDTLKIASEKFQKYNVGAMPVLDEDKTVVGIISERDLSRCIYKDKFKSDYNHMRQFKFDHKDVKAFGILGVSVGLKWQKIQEKFKILVKKFHPDMNSGNKKYEEKLKLITLAYTQLKNTYRDKIDAKS